jgi:hypothetical protein
MELQKSTSPSAEVPVIVDVLIAAVKESGGFSTQGIFRISATTEQLTQLRLQMDECNYVIDAAAGPHPPAALLKQWCRDLQKPLINDDVYPQCISAAKHNMSGGAIDDVTIGAIWKQIPALYQRVIKRIADMCSEIVQPENAATNLMSYKNLAIVFAPSLLRNPSDDPMELISNVKFEGAFVGPFLQYVARL